MSRRIKVPVHPDMSDWKEKHSRQKSFVDTQHARWKPAANGRLFYSLVNAAHQVSIHKKHREVHQNPGGQHEDYSIKAQDV